jgi:hypothetical protein
MDLSILKQEEHVHTFFRKPRAISLLHTLEGRLLDASSSSLLFYLPDIFFAAS